MPKKTRYLLIGLFFLVITALAIFSFFSGGSDKKTLFFAVAPALISILFLKNAFMER